MIRRYDSAVLDFIRPSLTMNGEKVPFGFAGQRREFGQQSELSSGESDRLGPRDNQTVKLPSIVLQGLDWELDEARYNAAKHRRLKWSDDLNLITQALHPLPYNLMYQVDIWTKFRADANVLSTAIAIKFKRRYAWLSVDMGYPWGVKKVALHQTTGIKDNSESESEEGDREIRKTIDLRLEAWLPTPPVDVRTVRKVIATAEVMWFDDSKGIDAIAFSKTLEEG